jgi:hypothetical protein
MGDKSPKSKQKNKEQKDTVKKQNVTNAKNKQTAQSSPTAVKGKK